MHCWSCQTALPPTAPGRKPGRQDTCPRCHAALHCCRACRFYDPNAHHECREPQADWVKEKDRANFCDWFDPTDTPTGPGAAGHSRQNAEDLWKKLTGGKAGA